MSAKKARAGFSLIEVLMVIGLISLVMGSVLGIFLTGHMAWNTGQINVQVQQQARHGMDAMVRELRLSRQTKVKIIDANTLTLQVPLNNATAGGDNRSRIGTDATSGELVWGAEGNPGYWIEYLVEYDQDLDRNVLRRKIFDAQPDDGGIEITAEQTILAYYIQSVNFAPDEFSSDPDYPQGIETTLTAAKGAKTYFLTTTVFFRN